MPSAVVGRARQAGLGRPAAARAPPVAPHGSTASASGGVARPLRPGQAAERARRGARAGRGGGWGGGGRGRAWEGGCLPSGGRGAGAAPPSESPPADRSRYSSAADGSHGHTRRSTSATAPNSTIAISESRIIELKASS